MAAALIGGMVSFPRAALGAIAIGVGERVLFFNFTSETGLVQFLLFVVVLLLVARVSKRDAQVATESFQFPPRVNAVPERLQQIWWVRHLPHLVAGLALAAAVTLPLFFDESARHQTWTTIVAFALCAVSVVVLTGWAGQLSLGQMAFAGLAALPAATLSRGVSLNVGWHDTRVVDGSLGPVAVPLFLLLGALIGLAVAVLIGIGVVRGRGVALSIGAVVVLIVAMFAVFRWDTGLHLSDGDPATMSFPWTLLVGAGFASLVAVIVGVGALRVRGLLLAISTLAFTISAQAYLFDRPFFTGGSSSVQVPRSDLGPWELTHKNRAYYYFTLAVLVVVLLLVGHLRRTGIGRAIVGVRENENAASAMTVSPVRAKLTAFALAGFIGGLGGVLLGAVNTTFGPAQRYFLVEDSLRLVSIAVIGGLGSLSGAVIGSLWVVGLPAFWPGNELVPLFTSSIGLLLILLYMPGGFVQIGYFARDVFFRWVEQRLPSLPTAKSVTAPPASLRPPEGMAPAACNADGSVLVTDGLTVTFGGLVAVGDVAFRADPGEVVGLIGNNGAGKSTLLNPIGGYVPSRGRIHLLGYEVSGGPTYTRARLGLGRHVPSRNPVSRADGARNGASRAGGTAPLVVLDEPCVATCHPPRAHQARTGGGTDRLHGSRPVRRPLHRRTLDGDASHRRVDDDARSGTAGDLSRRADGRYRATRSRSVRTAHHPDLARARRHPRRCRARSPAHHGYQRPHLLLGGRSGDRRGDTGHDTHRPPGDCLVSRN